MNWSGGYKNRFRLTSEVRKTAFQQQSRIVLVDLVKPEVDDDTEQTIHIPGNEKQEFSPTSSIVIKTFVYGMMKQYVTNEITQTDTSNDIPMQQQFGTPFKHIPCGTSSG